MAFNFLKSIFGSDTYLGVDIGTASIKLVEIARGKGLPKLNNYGVLESYGYLERVNNAIQTSSLRFFEKEVVEILNLLLSKVKVKTKLAVASLPSFYVFSTLIEIPMMSQSDTAKAMQYQARQYVPLSPTQLAIDWVKVGEREVDGAQLQQIFLISVTNDQIKRYQDIFKKVGLKLVALESESLALTRSAVSNDFVPTVLVDIGAKSTNIVIAEDGRLKLNNQTDFGGATLSQAIATGLGVSPYRAEELKKRHGLTGTGGNYELSTLMMSSLDAIINEVAKAISSHESRYENSGQPGKRRLERILLAGGGAKLPGIEKYFENQLGLPTVRNNPFARVDYPAELEPIIKEIGPSFSVVIGLGIRQLI